MKKYLLMTLASALILSACGPKKASDPLADSGRTQRTENLLTNLMAYGDSGVYMFGHHDDTVYGIGWKGDSARSDIHSVCNDYPGLLSFDLGHIELGDSVNLDGVPFDRMRQEIFTHFNRGGVITLSWHLNNPLSGGTAWVADSLKNVETKTVASVLEGGQKHEMFLGWIDKVADFLNSLETPYGVKVPVIFRPWHEHTGSWFWWGQKLCTDTEYRQLWNMLQDYLNGRGLDNLLWSYSPNLDGGWTEERFLQRYPGNDRVTLIGEDAYQWGTEADFVSQVTADLNFLSDFAKRNGKLLAMTECGLKNMPDATWWTRVLKPVMDRYPISYFLLWRNYKEEYFGPSPSLPCAQDFKKLYEAENTLFLKDIKKIK